MRTLRVIFAVILAVFLFFSLAAFIVSLSLNQVMDKQAIDKVVDDAVDSMVEEQLSLSNQEDGLRIIYAEVASQCEDSDSALLGGGEGALEINCDEVSNVVKEDFSDFFKSQIKDEIKTNQISGVYDFLFYVGWAVFVLGFISALSTALVILVAGSASVLILGIVGLVLIIPFMIIKFAEQSLTNLTGSEIIEGVTLGSLPQVEEIVGNVFAALSFHFLVFISLGVVLIILGVILKVVASKKKERGKK